MYHQLKNTILLPDIYIFLKIRKKILSTVQKSTPNVGTIVLKPDSIQWSGHGSDGLIRVNPKKNLYKTHNWLQIYNETLT